MASSEAELIAELNDLLQLDHDAIEAYSLAITALSDQSLKRTLTRYREDHERHVRDLTVLIEARGGTPLRLPHIPTGFFKLSMQALGIAGGDRTILMAFRANEGQVRNKYARHAERTHSPDVEAVLRRNAEDEARHYAWATEMLSTFGVGPGTMAGAANNAVTAFHGMAADVIEAAGRMGLEAFERTRRRN